MAYSALLYIVMEAATHFFFIIFLFKNLQAQHTSVFSNFFFFFISQIVFFVLFANKTGP